MPTAAVDPATAAAPVRRPAVTTSVSVPRPSASAAATRLPRPAPGQGAPDHLRRPADPGPDSGPWQHAAACVGLPPQVVFARRPKEAALALRACAVCPVRRACEEAVAPADSWFDGVCGGRLWRSGRPVAVPSRLLGGSVG
ncbi:WhiB family transcriptional regulator [Streptomyces sp. NPDC002845]